MKFLAILLFVVSFGAVAKDWDNAYKKFDSKSNFTDVTEIRWKQSDNILKACNEQSAMFKTKPITIDIEACSFWGVTDSKQWCLIITKKKLNLATLGHEVRHCFQGSWH